MADGTVAEQLEAELGELAVFADERELSVEATSLIERELGFQARAKAPSKKSSTGAAPQRESASAGEGVLVEEVRKLVGAVSENTEMLRRVLDALVGPSERASAPRREAVPAVSEQKTPAVSEQKTPAVSEAEGVPQVEDTAGLEAARAHRMARLQERATAERARRSQQVAAGVPVDAVMDSTPQPDFPADEEDSDDETPEEREMRAAFHANSRLGAQGVQSVGSDSPISADMVLDFKV